MHEIIFITLLTIFFYQMTANSTERACVLGVRAEPAARKSCACAHARSLCPTPVPRPRSQFK